MGPCPSPGVKPVPPIDRSNKLHRQSICLQALKLPSLPKLPQTLKMPIMTMMAIPAVAYINYDKASSAAMAIETLHETVLNEGKGPMVKVMFAEAPKTGQG